MDDTAVAFAMQCDMDGLTLEEGIERAERLCEDIMDAAVDRANYLTEENA